MLDRLFEFHDSELFQGPLATSLSLLWVRFRRLDKGTRIGRGHKFTQ